MQVDSYSQDIPGFAFKQVLSILPVNLGDIIKRLPEKYISNLEEIRLRQGRPLLLGFNNGDKYLTANGELVSEPNISYIITVEDIQRVTRLVSKSSLYALEEELKNGYITLPGGCRVGLTGKVVMDGEKVKTIKYISGLNIRISREVKGIAEKLLPYLLDKNKNVRHTLLLSPPRCGKTTLLRDLVRLLSTGMPAIKYSGTTVGLVDERSEIAGCYCGVPQKDVGTRTDVLDGCPKAQGMMMLLRAMGPNVLAADEIGKQEDVKVIEEVINAGVSLLFTVHGSTLEEITQRPALEYLFNLKVIERFVILGRSRGVGTIEDIKCGSTGKTLGGRICSS
ncbi:MAG: stage III sporulation protein AA [Clostridiales bacterium]|nr:stage III sporulation protein AA [Clostridiales bacterium]MCF8021168.1 stage III sporulation protein AA [Clostridiales bacterium]